MPDSVPWVGAVAAYVIGSPSGSDPDNVTGTDVSSATVTLWLSAVGGRLGAVTFTVTAPLVAHFGSECASVVPLSHTVYVNAATPAKPASGV